MSGYKHYYVNDHAQDNGDHEIHTEGCSRLETARSKTYLGCFPNCWYAIVKAKVIYIKVDGCAGCCKECHRSQLK